MKCAQLGAMLNHLHFTVVVLIVIIVVVVVGTVCFVDAVVHYNFFCRQLQDPLRFGDES